MVQPLDYFKETPSQTAGPYVHIGTNPNWVEITGIWNADLGLVLVGPETKGERILVEGRLTDGAGSPVRDALIEIWQADAAGLHNSSAETRGTADPAFAGWGRQPVSDVDGTYRFETIRPGAVPMGDGRLQAPHI
ncbi:MAG: protocatechuate 3,4-dioxygenase subunit alpha, partial [Methylobacterium sp.]